MPGGGMPMPGGGGMMPGGPMPGGMMPGGTMPGAAAAPKVVPLSSVRIVLVTDMGQIDAGAFEVEKLEEDDDGWSTAKVAFSDMKGPGLQEGAKLTGMVFTGNSGGSFYIGYVEITGG